MMREHLMVAKASVWMCVAAAGAGCAQTRQAFEPGRTTEPGAPSAMVSKEELRDRLEQFYDVFETRIQQATDQLVDLRTSRRAHRLTLLWQLRILPMARHALDQEHVLGGFLDLWTLCIRQENYLTSGDGQKLFGKDQHVAVDAAHQCVQEIEQVAKLIMPADMIERASRRVRELAAANPLRGEFSGTDVRTLSSKKKKDDVLGDVLTIPLVPFRWLGGVDESAQAIKGFTAVAARMTDVVRGFSVDARLQMELFMLEMEELRSIREALDSFERLSKSSERIASVAEGLPPRLREELGRALDDMDKDRPRMQKAIDDARELVEKLRPTGESVSQAARALADAAKAIEEMVASFRRPAAGGAETSSAAEEGRPFDINEYRATADSMTAAAKALEGAISDFRALAADEALPQRFEQINNHLNGVTDHAAWRLVQVVFLIFALAGVFGYWARRRGRLT